MHNKHNIDSDKELEIKYTENPEVSKSLVNSIKKKKSVFGILAVIFAVMVKFKVVIFLALAKLKYLILLLKLGKFTSTLISMLFMIVIYAQIYGVAYGMGFVLLLFFHEMGHYILAKRFTMNPSGPVFIPFIGAFVNTKKHPLDAVTEAKIALGGPILGSFGALICVFIYMYSYDNLFLALAYTGFTINLLNLIPVYPLDGGRIVTAISTKVWFVGIPILLFISVKFFNPIIILLLIMGIIQAYKQWKEPNIEFYKTSTFTKIGFSIVYFALLASLGFGIFYIHNLHFMYLK